MKIKRRRTDPAREQSVTTLKQWQRLAIPKQKELYPKDEADLFFTGIGIHPITLLIASYFRKKPTRKPKPSTDTGHPQSVTTLADWRKGSNTSHFHTDLGWVSLGFYHPIVAEVSRFFRKVEKVQKQGLEAVLAFQESLKGGKHAIH